ncbi:MAG TPA: hypothetical protein VFB60_11770 [Ktedonobacteraceae bacterium]|nr:hypothetical protein [Ktedonobacteraceae bacterium]
MQSFVRSKMSVTISLLTLITLLASVAIFQAAMPSVAHAATASAPTQTLLTLNSLGAARLTAASGQTTQGASDIEVSPAADRESSPKLEINGSTPPPIAPPPAGTAPPNPAGLNVTTNNPGFRGFNGLSHFDQRNAGTGAFTNTQFSLEPPDQGLCASNNFVLDTVNTALAVRSTNGTILTGPTPINQFFGLAPEVVRSTPPVFGDFTSDPKCFFDPTTQHWFLTVLHISVDPASGAMQAPTHTLIAVSQTADPTGTWRTFSIDTTDDGSNGTPSHPNCPCLGDQPLIGANADGFFVSTNEFGLAGGFNGAQVYAISKRGLVQAASNPGSAFTSKVVHIDASQALVPFGGLSFSIQPSTQPFGIPLGLENNGTEYFLSSLDFTGTVDNRIATWALTNTRSLNQSTPNVSLTFTVIKSQLYGQPVPVTQKNGPTPFATSQGAPIGFLNSNDDRMNQVVFAAGVLWSGVNTIVQKPGEAARTGIAFFGVLPFFADGQLHAILVKSGYVAVDGENVLFPSIGVNAIGEGVMSFTLSGPDFFPSAAYMPISLFHTGDVHVASAGASPEDGFTCVAPDRLCRWGDYSAAVASPDGRSIWLATEFIPNTPRTVLANWGTFISNVDV